MWRIGLIALLAINATQLQSACAEEPPQSPARSAPVEYMGRTIAPTMHFSGAGWLVRDTRDQEEQPAKLLKALEIKEGECVCDFGCGNGFYTLQLARMVGPRGSVYAVDIQPEMLDLLAKRAEPRGFANVRPVLATAAESGLPAGQFDLLLMVDVYHELSDPVGALAAVRASLKPRGRVAFVEFREEDPTVPILPLHKMSKGQVVREISANKLKLVGQFDELPWQHVLFFARDDSPLESQKPLPWPPTP